MSLNSKRRNPRGSIILLAIFFLIVLFSLAVAFFRIIPAEFHTASQAKNSVQAQYAADAGLREAVEWLRMQSAVSSSTLATWSTAHSNPNDAAAKIDNEWSYTCSMTEVDASRKIYEVVSTAYHRGRAVRELRTTIRNETFAKYALFYDTWDDLPFTMGSNSIQGPFHTNDYFNLMAPGGTAFWEDGKQPFVNGPLAKMTYVTKFDNNGDGNKYIHGNFPNATPNYANMPYDDEGTPLTDRYNRMISGGRERMVQVQEVPFPAAVTELKTESWGSTTPMPTSGSAWNALVASAGGGMIVNTDDGPNTAGGTVEGGIYIRGNADKVRFEITPEGHQKTRIKQGSTSISVPPTITYYKDVPVYSVDVPRYKLWIQPPPYENEIPGPCIASHTEQVPNTHWVNYPTTEFGQHSSCDPVTTYIPGPGGITIPIQVFGECEYQVDHWVEEPDGTFTEVTVCDEYGPSTFETITPPGYWDEDVPEGTPGAEPNGFTTVPSTEGAPGAYQSGTNQVVTTEADPDGYPVETGGTASIENWQSVVEVNDTTYEIPFVAGMTINGVQHPTDPGVAARTVAAGSTVKIKNDTPSAGGNIAYTVMEGSINGIMFSDGHLNDTQGVVKGAKHGDANGENVKYRGRTVATDIQANKRIEISGDILQYYDGNGSDANGPLNNGNDVLRAGAQSPDESHILGMVATNININQSGKSSNFQNTWDPETGEITNYDGGITVYGVLMAGNKLSNGTVQGGFGAHEDAMRQNDGIGDFNLFGGIISGNARRTQNPYEVGDNNFISCGFRLNLNYDEIAAMNLENFPQTTEYSVIRYVTVSLDSLNQGFGALDGK